MFSSKALTLAQLDFCDEKLKPDSTTCSCGRSLMKTDVRSTRSPPLGPLAMMGRLNSTLSVYVAATARASGELGVALKRTFLRTTWTLSPILRNCQTHSSPKPLSGIPPRIYGWPKLPRLTDKSRMYSDE